MSYFWHIYAILFSINHLNCEFYTNMKNKNRKNYKLFTWSFVDYIKGDFLLFIYFLFFILCPVREHEQWLPIAGQRSLCMLNDHSETQPPTAVLISNWL